MRYLLHVAPQVLRFNERRRAIPNCSGRIVRSIAAVAIAAAATATASAQQVAGEYIVDSRIISDVAIGKTADAGDYQTSPSDGYVNPHYDASAGAVEYVDGGVVQEGSGGRVARGSGRLAALAHGGEQGPFIPKQYAQPDLFYNYYSNGQNQVNAEMYIAPGPVPPFVGHTWVPYQPYMPHNYLYKHTDTYHNHYDYGRGTNRTKATYSVSPKQYAQTLYNVFRIPR